MTGTAFIYHDAPGFRHEPLRWAWAIGAIYNAYHAFPVDLPVGPETAERDYAEGVSAARTYLPRDWDITDRQSLVTTLIHLGRAGHRRGHRALVRRLCALPAQAWEQYEATDRERAAADEAGAHQRLWRMWAVDRDIMGCRTASFLAFDAARAAQLVRNGFALGYLEEPEMRAYLYDLAREVAATFGSWEAFAHDFLAGRSFWAAEQDETVWPPLIAELGIRPDSPWTRLPFAFPEDEESRVITSADTRDGPFWTLETAPSRAAWPEPATAAE